MPRKRRRQLGKKPIASHRGWRLLPGRAWKILSAVAAVGGVFVFYPWLSIQIDERTNPRNPYEDSIHLENDGFLPIRNITVTCTLDATGAPNLSNIAYSPIPQIAETLPYRGKLTLPCNHSVVADGRSVQFLSASLTINVAYNVWFLPFSRNARFRLVAEKDGRERWHWMYR